MGRYPSGEPDYQRAARLTARRGAPGPGAVVAAAGVWLVLAPSVLEYPDGGAVINDGVVGAVVAIVAITGAAVPRAASWSSGTTALLGVWEVASPFVLGHGSGSSVVANQVVVGLVVVVLSLAGVAVSVERSCSRSPMRARPSRWERRRARPRRVRR
ncbi:SPW repeat domain-containing protein [Saccharothrix carnea]|nr:SPW repeat protein [Saccharothrix carnea]